MTNLTDSTVDELRGVFDKEDKLIGVLGAGRNAGKVIKVANSARLNQPSRHVEPAITDEVVTVTWGPSADGATANTEYAALGTPTYRFDRAADIAASLKRIELDGLIRADRVEENLGTRLDQSLLATTTTPFFSQGSNGAILLMTASPNVTLVGYPNAALTCRVLVNGRRLSGSDVAGRLTGPVATTAGRPNWIKLTFPDARPRIISCGMNTLKSIFLDAGYYAVPPATRRPTLLEAGDSFLARVCATGEAAAWGNVGLLAARAIGLNAVNIAQGGTGWLSTAGDTRYNYRQGLKWLYENAPGYKPQNLLMWGSGNDNGFRDGLRQQVTDTLKEALTYWPDLENIMVTGVYGGYNSDAVASDLSARIKDGVAAVGDGRIEYMPVHTPETDDPMFTGTGSVPSPAGDGNADLYFSSAAQGAADRHPNRGGVVYASEYLARRMFACLTGAQL